MGGKLGLKDLDVKGRRVLMRVDFNVPQDNAGKITDDKRIRAALPSIQAVLRSGGSLVLMSHLGRPKGKPDPKFSLAPCAQRLSELLRKPVRLLPDCIGPAVARTCAALKPGEVVLLENLRFHAEEQEGEAAFAAQIAALGDLYVNDAFGTCHRPDASMVAVPKAMSKAAAGFLVQKEIEFLSRALESPEHPYLAILGGAKVSDKITVIRKFLDNVDGILIGGAMAYAFLKAKGIGVGNSRIEKAEGVDAVAVAREVLADARKRNIPIELPVDNFAVREFKEDATAVLVQERDPRRPDGGGHRPGDRPALQPEDRRREDGRLERPDGRLRDGIVRRGDARDRRGAREEPGGHHRRRRRHGRCGGEVRAGRKDGARLHRRRRLAGIPRREGTSRNRRADGRGINPAPQTEREQTLQRRRFRLPPVGRASARGRSLPRPDRSADLGARHGVA